MHPPVAIDAVSRFTIVPSPDHGMDSKDFIERAREGLEEWSQDDQGFSSAAAQIDLRRARARNGPRVSRWISRSLPFPSLELAHFQVRATLPTHRGYKGDGRLGSWKAVGRWLEAVGRRVGIVLAKGSSDQIHDFIEHHEGVTLVRFGDIRLDEVD